MQDTEIIRRYKLEGGSQVTVIRPFKGGVYAAVVEMKLSQYPGQGLLAINRNRNEQLYILEGELTVKSAGKIDLLKVGETKLLAPGQPYHLSGSCRVLVIVEDQASGETEIVSG